MSNLLHRIDLLADNIPWLHDLRRKGKEVFAQLGVPHAKVEAWKYTKPNMFLDSNFIPSLKLPEIDYQPALPFDCYKICFINGVFAPQASLLPEQIEVMPIIEAVMFKPEIRDKIGKLADINRHPFAALANAYFNHRRQGIVACCPQRCPAWA